MLQTGKQVLKKASKGGYAVGHFNFSNLESLEAIVQAAQNTNSPVFAATSEGGIEYGGVDYLAAIAKIAAKNAKVPVVLHLDHGKDMRYINAAITHGYTSIMIDASSFPLKENIRITKKVVILCHQKGISVEAELGCLQGIEDKVSEKESIFTSPKEAVYFVKETGVDSLAISVGTSHGAYKFKGRSRIDIARIRLIKKLLNIPLVLHGASGVPHSLVAIAEKYGAKLGDAHGVSDTTYRQAIAAGINKINVDTDLRLAFDAGIRKTLKENPSVFDPRKILGPSTLLMTKVIEQKMKVFGSAGKA